MNKLELKHIVGYLPYGLFYQKISKGNFNCSPDNIEILRFSINDITDLFILRYRVKSVKPILRPLSDLTKEIDHNGQKFVPLVELMRTKKNGDWIVIQNRNKPIEENQYYVIQKLYEWHFDIHNLIEKGLAIDINNIVTKP